MPCPAASASVSPSRARLQLSRALLCSTRSVSALDVSIQGQIVNLLPRTYRRAAA